MERTPPDILITTPESLYLLLTSAARRILRSVRWVILDEIHSVAATKRGAHLAISLERLCALTEAEPQRIGLSATQRPLEEVGRFLVGAGREVEIVDAGRRKTMEVRVEVPVEVTLAVAVVVAVAAVALTPSPACGRGVGLGMALDDDARHKSPPAIAAAFMTGRRKRALASATRSGVSWPWNCKRSSGARSSTAAIVGSSASTNRPTRRAPPGNAAQSCAARVAFTARGLGG